MNLKSSTWTLKQYGDLVSFRKYRIYYMQQSIKDKNEPPPPPPPAPPKTNKKTSVHAKGPADLSDMNRVPLPKSLPAISTRVFTCWCRIPSVGGGKLVSRTIVNQVLSKYQFVRITKSLQRWYDVKSDNHVWKTTGSAKKCAHHFFGTCAHFARKTNLRHSIICLVLSYDIHSKNS